VTDKTVAAVKQQAKWNEDLHRRATAEKIIDYYYNRQDLYLAKALENSYPNSHEDMWKYRDFLNLTESIYDDISIVFEEPVTIAAKDGTDAVEELLNDMTSSSMLNPVMQKVNVYTNMLKKCGVMPHYDKESNKVILEIITPDKVFVKQNEEIPSKADEVWVQIGIMSNSPHSVDKVIKYSVWTIEEQRIVSINSSNGRIIKEHDKFPNPYKRIPIVWFTNDIEEDCFWFDLDNYIVKKNEIINQDLTAARFGTSLQSFSTLVMEGFDNHSDIKMGVQRPIIIPTNDIGESQGKAYYITPGSDLEKIYNIIDGKALDAARSLGVSAESYKRKGSTFSSGYQLKLSKSDVLKRNKRDRAFYEPKLRELIELMMLCFSINNPTKRFPEGTEVTIDFGEIKIEDNPMEQAKINGIELSQNLTSGPRLLMRRNPDLTLDEAKQLFNEIKAENQQFSIGAGLARVLDIGGE